MHATAVSTAWRHQDCTSGMPHAETPCGLEPASGPSPALTALSQAPAQTRRCAVAVRAAARCSAWGYLQYAAAPKQHVVLDAQQVAEKRHICTRAWGLARYRPSIGSVSSCAARVEICQKLPGRSRETCASVRNRSHPHAGHSSQPPHVPGEARRGGRTPSSRGQPASR